MKKHLIFHRDRVKTPLTHYLIPDWIHILTIKVSQQNTLRQACSHKILLESVVFQTHFKGSWKGSLWRSSSPTYPSKRSYLEFWATLGLTGNLPGQRRHISLLTCSSTHGGKGFLNVQPKAHQYLHIIWSDFWNHTLPSWDFQHNSALEQVLSKNPSGEVTQQVTHLQLYQLTPCRPSFLPNPPIHSSNSLEHKKQFSILWGFEIKRNSGFYPTIYI